LTQLPALENNRLVRSHLRPRELNMKKRKNTQPKMQILNNCILDGEVIEASINNKLRARDEAASNI
jgi:hypothetical protein